MPAKWESWAVVLPAVAGGWLYLDVAAYWLDTPAAVEGTAVDVGNGAVLAILESLVLLVGAVLAMAASHTQPEPMEASAD